MSSLPAQSNHFALSNGRIVLPNEIVNGKAVVVDDGKIAGLADIGALGTDIPRVDVGGRYISPGLIGLSSDTGWKWNM